MMQRQPPRLRPLAPVSPLSRSQRRARPERALRERLAAPLRLTDPRLRLDRPLYYLLNADGTTCTGRVWQGECVLLFTSPGAAATFAGSAGVEAQPSHVFSRSRTEFLTQARRSFGEGFIGGLIDPTTQIGETEFLGFDVDQRQGGA
jgi:hypothetical protein